MAQNIARTAGLRAYLYLRVALRGPTRIPCRALMCTAPDDRKVREKVTIHFINQDGEKITTSASEGETLLDIVLNKNLDINGFGACEGTLACSTCHLIFDEDVFKKMGPVLDEEMDMLDLSYGLTDTSRLGCQICVQKWMDGIVIRVPQEMNDMRRKKESARK
ncbi:ferredoxin 1b [Erpetoichthys calabaricus]|uniref:Ferredoxin 1b n=1 Tax=Erpetoichthys calabaricus TaxID=27687 RepID=A0A8C4SGH1_ERPCA|nr:ferredoxin 1b [Erpetoichthys calabaricus]